MNEQAQKIETPAGLAGTVSLGGELTVRRLGFGAMRITGDGIWGPPKDPDTALRVLRRAVELGVNFIATHRRRIPATNQCLRTATFVPRLAIDEERLAIFPFHPDQVEGQRRFRSQ